jgi:hypothetical protein
VAGTYDDASDLGEVEYVPQGHGPQADRVARGHTVEDLQERLEQVPAAELVDDESVLGEGSVLEWLGRRAGLKPALGQKAACQRAVAQELDAVRATEVDHAPERPGVEERELHLMCDHRHAGLDELGETRDVEVGHPDVSDLPLALALALALELMQPAGDLHVPWHVVVPPVKLDQIQALRAETQERAVDGPLDVLAGQRRQLGEVGHVLGVNLGHGLPARQPLPAPPQELTNQILDAGVDVGAIEGRDARLVELARGRARSARGAEVWIVAVVTTVVMLTTHSVVAILAVGEFAKETGERFGLGAYRRANLLDVTVCTWPFLLPYFLPTLLAASATASGAVAGMPQVSPLAAGLHNVYSWGLLGMVFGPKRSKTGEGRLIS